MKSKNKILPSILCVVIASSVNTGVVYGQMNSSNTSNTEITKPQEEKLEVAIKNPLNGHKILESYTLRYSVSNQPKPQAITISYRGSENETIEVPVTPNETGSYETTIVSIGLGENTIKIKAEYPAAPGSSVTEPRIVETEVGVNVEEAITTIMFGEENKGPYSNDKNQFKNLMKAKNTELATSKGIAPKSDAYIDYFVDTLIAEAQAEGVRPDVVFSQIMLETAWLTYGGDVNESQYNFGGIGATGGGVMGNVFTDIEQGLRANVQHLVAYASTKELNNELVDPRFHLLSSKRGTSPTVEQLGYFENTSGAGWAYSVQYGTLVKDLMTKLSDYDNSEFKVEAPQEYNLDLFLSYINVDGISTVINQGEATTASTIRAAISTNDLVNTKFKITSMDDQVITETDYQNEPFLNFTVPGPGTYKVEASVRPLESTGDAVKTVTKDFDINTKVVDKSIVPETPAKPGENPEDPKPGDAYTLYNAVGAYTTAADAINKGEASKNYEAGVYYVYKVHDGMLNISTKKGSAGAWINPSQNDEANYTPESSQPNSSVPQGTTTTSTNVTTTAQTTKAQEGTNNTNYTVGSEITVDKAIAVYGNAGDAKNQINSLKNYEPGQYFIYKEFEGMINISKTQGSPGAWVNPSVLGNTNTTPTTTTPQITTPTSTTPTTSIANTTTASSTTGTSTNIDVTKMEVGSQIVTVDKVPVYGNASDAKNKANVLKTYDAGNYYIYKVFEGMVNISKTKGTAGAWVNPNELKLNNSDQTPGAGTTTTTTTPTPNTSATTKAITVGSVYSLSNVTAKYMDEADAKNNTNSTGFYTPGMYYVYKVSGDVINISRTPGIPGAWINTKVSTTPTTPTTTPGTTTNQSETFQLKVEVNRYFTSEDALQKKNSLGKMLPGTYYVYKKSNDAMNLTLRPGVAGYWVSIKEAQDFNLGSTDTMARAASSNTINTLAVTTTTQEATYQVIKSINVYANAFDALNKSNPIKQYPPGTYYIFKQFEGMLNISLYQGGAGAWINPEENRE